MAAPPPSSGGISRVPALAGRLATALPWIWAGGSPSTFAVLALGLIGGERLRKSVRRVEEGAELDLLCRRLGESLGIVRRVALGISDRVATPILLGIVRPLILLPPAALTGWGVERVEMVLLHELAHVRRRDNLVNLGQRVLESILFYHPAVWWASAWARVERERCCDATVVARTGRRRSYAELLAALAAPHPAERTASAVAAHPVVARIRLILEPEVPPMKIHRAAIAIAAALTLLPTVLIASYARRLGEVQEPKPGTPAASAKPDPIEGEDRDAMRRALEIVAGTARPDDVQALLALAKVQADAGDREGSRETLRRALVVAEESPQPSSRVYNRLFVADWRGALGDRQGAGEIVRRAIEVAAEIPAPGDRVAALAYAAQVQVQLGDRPAGEETLKRAIALQQTLPDRDPSGGETNIRLTAFHRIVEALVECGEPERAVELSANDPDSINIALSGIARSLPKIKDRESVRAILGRALEISARSRFSGERGQALAEVAEIRAKLGDFDAAITTARRIGEGPDAPLNRNYLSSSLKAVGEAAAAAGRGEQARALLRESFAVAKVEDPSSRANQARFIAQAQAKAGDLDGARESIAAIGDDSPRDRAEALIALATAEVGDKPLARATLLRAAEAAERIGPRPDIGNYDLAWTRSYVQNHIAVARAKLGDYEGAVAILRDKVGDKFSERANGLHDVVKVQIAAGDLAGALRTSRALQIDDFRAGLTSEAIAFAQARAGDASGVLAWAEATPSPYVKARALVGMIRGLSEKRAKPREPDPADRP